MTKKLHRSRTSIRSAGASLLAGFAACVLALGLTTPTYAGQEQYLSDEQLSGLVADQATGVAFNVFRSGGNFMTLSVMRTAPAKPELHDSLADFFIVRQGTASVRVGGELIGAKSSSPGEWSGGEIKGGKLQKLAPGDVLWIPAGMPHQVLPDPGQSFRYLVVKVLRPGAAPLAATEGPTNISGSRY